MKKAATSTHPSPTTAAPSGTTAIGSYGMAISRALQASGVDSARVFRAVGVPMDTSNDPMPRLPTATLTRLYQACVEVTNNPYFGLVVARHMHISNMHALGYALAASATLMDYCRRLERFFRLVSQVATVTVSEQDNEVHLRFAYLTEISGETEDAFFAFTVTSMRLLYRRSLFGQADGLLVFDRNDLTQNLAGSCPGPAQVNDSIAINYLAKLDKNDVITGVTQKIIPPLPEGQCNRDKVASALCMSPTTLQLKLSQRGTNFQKLLDDTRRDLASSYVRQGTRSVTEITFLLGFTDTSNFTRAFKRWTGMSPTEFKASSP